jgi:uncharacterized protein YfiM (DUF2279 family)
MKKLVFLLFVLAVLDPIRSSAQMDKALHTSAGFGITITVSAATNKPKLGLLTGIGAGIGKELWDAQRVHHQASARDFYATAAGSSAAYIVWKYALNRRRRPQIAMAPAPQEPAACPAMTNTRPGATPTPSSPGAVTVVAPAGTPAIVPGGTLHPQP